jgi:FkbM family methyltransferase
MGIGYLARHMTWRSPTVRVHIKRVGRVTLRRHSSDGAVIREVFGERSYELRSLGQWRRIDARYQEILLSGHRPMIIDAGANIGAASLWFALEFPEAKVVAVEPEPSNAQLCYENTGSFDVEVVPMAIGSHSGTVSLITELRDYWATATVRSCDGDVDICTVNDIVKGHQPECELFLVKIDIEGFESDLFSANVEWVGDAQVIFVEPHDWLLPGQATSRNFQRVLAEHDFELIVSGANLLYIRHALENRQPIRREY